MSGGARTSIVPDPRLEHVGKQLDGLLQLVVLRKIVEVRRRRACSAAVRVPEGLNFERGWHGGAEYAKRTLMAWRPARYCSSAGGSVWAAGASETGLSVCPAASAIPLLLLLVQQTRNWSSLAFLALELSFAPIGAALFSTTRA